METIDFGCQVRCLNRQRLVPGPGHPPLNECASQFLARVRQQSSTAPSLDSNRGGGWMKLRLSERGLRIFPPASPSGSSTGSTSGAYRRRRADEGFESDSDGRNSGSEAAHSGSGSSSSSSSGVNSSSSDIEEAETSLLFSSASSERAAGVATQLDDDDEATAPTRCSLNDILSCQHPPALGRHVVLLTLRSPDDAALDILALECSAQEPARILTLLCQKIANSAHQSNHAKEQREQAKPVVSIQPWTERATSPEPEAAKSPSAQTIIRKLERQQSSWNAVQRRGDDRVGHLQVANSPSSSNYAEHLPSKKSAERSSRKDLPPSGLKRSDSVLTKSSKSSTNEPDWSNPSKPAAAGGGTKRWTFGAPFRQTVRAASPDSSPATRRSRGRSVERKLTKGGAHQPDLEGLYIGNQPEQPAPKIKRDPSKTRSFLMKWTATKKPASTPAPASDLAIGTDVPAAAPAAIGLRQRGRSLVRLRSTRNISPAPVQQQQPVHPPHTFLIPTKSGHELTRTLYPKESGVYSALGPAAPPQAVYYVPSAAAGRGLPRIGTPYYSATHWSYCWNEPSVQADANNNNNSNNSSQQQWIYFQPLASAAAPARELTKAEWKRIQRSRSQSPARSRSTSTRLLAPASGGPYYAAPAHASGVGAAIVGQPTSLPPADMLGGLMGSSSSSASLHHHLHQQQQQQQHQQPVGRLRSFRRSKSSTRMATSSANNNNKTGATSDYRSDRSVANQHSSNKAVTFNAFATVQLVD